MKQPSQAPPLSNGPPGASFVVVAEDDHSLRELLTIALQRRQLDTIAVEDGLLALGEIERCWEQDLGISLLITDVQMPRLSGLELLSRLGAAHRPPPTIVISSFMSSDLRAEALGLGAQAVFSKPFDIRKFMAVVDRIVAR